MSSSFSKWLASLGICFIFLLAVALPAAASYLPLAEGNFWSYVDDNGQRETRVVAGTVQIFGTTVFALETTESPENSGLVNFWTTASDGDLLLWGFERETWGVLYQPPLTLLDAPLSLGRQWFASTSAFTLPDTIPFFDFDFGYTVFSDSDLTVPAGTFPAFGIGETGPAITISRFGAYTLSGEYVGDREGAFPHWYAWDVGVVQYEIESLFRLDDYNCGPVAVETTTWSGLKALFR